MSRHQGYCFTVNNFTDEDVSALHSLIDSCRYCIYATEVGESGTPHIQGFAYFHNARTLSAVRRDLPRGHFEVARGTPKQASDYCKKDGDFVEIGICPISQEEKGRRERARWENIYELCKDKRFADLPAGFVCLHPGNPERIRRLYLSTVVHGNLERLENQWLVGEAGAGKSRYAREWAEERQLRYYVKMCNQWWDGYEGEEVVIIEEWSHRQKDLVELLKQWADRYPFRGEVKGGSLMLRPKHIIVTSNFEPGDIWIDARDLEPIRRRFDVFKVDPPTFEEVEQALAVSIDELFD